LISVSKDNEDKIISYCESRVVGQSGFDKLHGEYIYIADLWIHESHKNDWSIFRELMNDILRKAQSAKWIYFQRKKYGGRMSKLYTRSRIMKLLDRSPMMILREVA
jgi:hypothetical protein